MGRGMPSMTALLAMLAIAGYQNRDKLAELLKGAGSSSSPGGQPPLGGVLGNLGGMLGAGGIGACSMAELASSWRGSTRMARAKSPTHG